MFVGLGMMLALFPIQGQCAVAPTSQHVLDAYVHRSHFQKHCKEHAYSQWLCRCGTSILPILMHTISPLMSSLCNVIMYMLHAMSLLPLQRVKYINEVLAGIRVVKMYGWEGAMHKRILEVSHFSHLSPLATPCNTTTQ
jgi:hypothetical protein